MKVVLNNRVVILSLYMLLIACMGIATIMGNGDETVEIYGSWWFPCLWGILALCSLFYLVEKKTYRRMAVMMLHLSFVVILIGALTTRLTSSEGTVHLRIGEDVTAYVDNDSVSHSLPFAMRLTDFEIIYYPGTDGIMDYKAEISVVKPDETAEICVSMNNIGKAEGYRFYQSSYDSDSNGTVLIVAYDPYGIAITYIGYVMLFLSLLWTLFSRQTKMRHYYRIATKAAVVFLMLFAMVPGIKAQDNITKIDPEIADEMGKIAVLYQGRICPLNTPATEFVTKLCGKSSWNGFSANEIFAGWMIYYTEWETQPIIEVKSKAVQRMIGIDDKWACVKDFYNADNSYKLSGKSNDTSIPESERKAIRDVDEKIQVITMFYNSEMLHIFPLSDGKSLRWYTPGSTDLPQGVGGAEFQFINHAMDYLVRYILANDVEGAKGIISKIGLYQKDKAGKVLPSAFEIKMEIAYNSLHSARWVTFLCLALAFAFCFLSFRKAESKWLARLSTYYIIGQTAFLTVILALRWSVSGHIPLSNGYETMLFMAWTVLVMTLAVMRKAPIFKAFGPIVSSLCMLVATLATGSPQVTPLMPVLQSPLLSVHVALVMMAYSLFAVVALIAMRSIWLCRQGGSMEYERLTALSRLLLYPAVALLAGGIFIGAVWANVSWGTYWSWDPKETWALITLLVYAIPLHETPLDSPAHPQRYHLYVLSAFLTILMTYFGVNYFLVGMHSYVG